uniref:Uncharacterized protein n=1 Tax=Glossina morsitans morsitans TaxID=37546 RepID=A0A1B0FHE9_GLOMM
MVSVLLVCYHRLPSALAHH